MTLLSLIYFVTRAVKPFSILHMPAGPRSKLGLGRLVLEQKSLLWGILLWYLITRNTLIDR